MTIDDMPAGRGMDGLIHSLVLDKSFENYCLHSLHPNDGQCNGCDLPCPMPRYSIRWDLISDIESHLHKCGYLLCLSRTCIATVLLDNWIAVIVHKGIFAARPTAHLSDIDEWHAYGQDAPEAVGRAALKWAVDGKGE